MTRTLKNGRAAAWCEECENIYAVTIHREGEIEPIGVPNCRDCGECEFTLLGELGKELIETGHEA